MRYLFRKQLYKFRKNRLLCFFKKKRKEHLLFFPSEGDEVTVCIPVYRSLFLQQTLACLEKQTWPHFQVLLSFDDKDRESYALCLPYFRDRRYRFYLQPKRLGWIEQLRFLFSKVQTPLVSILPHDDVLHPLYLQELVFHLSTHPQCCLVYTDTELIDKEGASLYRFFIHPSVKGSLVNRMCSYLLTHYNAVGFRSVFRKSVLDKIGPLLKGPFEDFGADTFWLGKFCSYGELHRIALVFCQKRYHLANTHASWLGKPESEQIQAWDFHCEQLFSYFSTQTSDFQEIEKLRRAFEIRKKHRPRSSSK